MQWFPKDEQKTEIYYKNKAANYRPTVGEQVSDAGGRIQLIIIIIVIEPVGRSIATLPAITAIMRERGSHEAVMD